VHERLRGEADPALSQYFLVSPEKLAAVVRAAGIRPSDHVAELGAGAGTVARCLPPSASLTLVELDPRFAARLREEFPAARVIEGDALSSIREMRFDVLIGNLPHGVTDELLPMLRRLCFRTAVLSASPAARLDDLGPGLTWSDVTTTGGDDFVPPQPVRSRVVRIQRES
jgi:16S rRNA A1518/A1519 N6-dimethyltransferase RsmA/KsgA/DIM1 with predicted DNA glycosylase/AP lyase activity